MQALLMEVDNQTLHASVFAQIIFEQKLYIKAQYNQIRARCGHYLEIFEALAGKYIRLK